MPTLSGTSVTELTFTDPDDLETTFNRQQNFQVVQLDQQPLWCHILTLTLNGASFSFRKLDNPLRIWGNKRSDFLVFEFLMASETGSLLSHGTAIQSGTLYGFDSTRGINMVLSAKTMMASFTIQRQIVQDYLEIMDRTDLNDRFFSTNYVQSPGFFVPVQQYLREVYDLVKRRSPFLEQPQISKLLLEDYLPLLIGSIPPQNAVPQSCDCLQSRKKLVLQAEEYMLSNLEQPITLKDLSQALHTSKSPLTYGFQEVFGTSPMAYLKLLRLRAIHKILKAADPTIKITEVAQRFGFWHAGRFSQEYKQLFGQSPSVTLRR